MSNQDESNWGPRDELGLMIKNVPYHQPPTALSQRIMRDLRPKRPGWLKRLYLRITTPIHLSLSPLAASAMVAFLFISGGFLYDRVVPDQPSLSTPSRINGHVPVQFRFQAPEAQSVSVIGTFNHWNPKGYDMVQDAETKDWILRIELVPGKHDYVFLVNGKEIEPDPRADISRTDDYGNRNSILFIKGPNGHTL